MLKEMVKAVLPRFLVERIHRFRYARATLRPIAKRECNICGFAGIFSPFGRPARLDAECPKCKSLERHRLLMLALERGLMHYEPARVLHFAPEKTLEQRFRTRWRSYQTADLFQPADLTLNLEAIDLPDECIDLIIANHVLEHVDDGKASKELSRILSSNGILLCMVPIVEGWAKTYENPNIRTDQDRMLYFGQDDHMRFYGRDFRDRISKGGFNLRDEITAEGEDVIRWGLLRGEKVFVFEKN